MKAALGLAALFLLVSPVLGADKPAVAIWTPAELKEREAKLSKTVGPDHSSRETLADYGHHRFRYLYRDADGNPEQHDHIIDIRHGAERGRHPRLWRDDGRQARRRDARASGSARASRAASVGRWRPATWYTSRPPFLHSFLVPKGKHITYVLIKFPSE